MNSLYLLTQSANSFLRPIARVLGLLMEGIYNLMDNLFNIQNIALTIVIFTVIIYIIMLPLTYQQQKFSKMSMIMNPEIQEIQKKYRGKRDSESMTKQNEETQEVYRKYGVRPSGSCVFLIIQFLILIPLYRVIYSVPGYVTRVRETFTDLVTAIMATDGWQNTITAFKEVVSDGNSVMNQVSLNFSETTTDAANSIIDVLYRCTSSNWHLLERLFDGFPDLVQSTQVAVEHFNSFLSASIVYSPLVLIRTSAAEGAYLLIFIGILIPVISAGSQLVSILLMPQPNTGSGDQMGNQMRTMNYIMPIYSFFIVFFLPIGIGIYWIAGAVIRIIQQYFINRHFNRIDMNELIEKNKEKADARQKKKIERKGVAGERISSAAAINTKQIPRSMSERAASVAKINAEQGVSDTARGGSTKSKGTKSSGTKSSAAKSGASGSSGTKNSASAGSGTKSSGTKSAASAKGGAKSDVTAKGGTGSDTSAGIADGNAASADGGTGSDTSKGGGLGRIFGFGKGSSAKESDAAKSGDGSGTQSSKKSNGKYKEGSLASYANKVTEYNERNSKNSK